MGCCQGLYQPLESGFFRTRLWSALVGVALNLYTAYATLDNPTLAIWLNYLSALLAAYPIPFLLEHEKPL